MNLKREKENLENKFRISVERLKYLRGLLKIWIRSQPL